MKNANERQSAQPVALKKSVALKNKKFSSDLEFLPAALAVLESPPSPIKIQLLYTVCALVVVAFIWSFIGRFDVIATAQGKLQPQGQVKVVESLVPGKVASILVQNGDSVKAGQALALLEPTDAQAQFNNFSSSFSSWSAEVVRRKTQDALARKISLASSLVPIDADITWPKNRQLPADITYRETTVMHGELSKLDAELEDIRGQIRQNLDREQGIRQMIASQQNLLETLNQRLELRRKLLEENFVSRDEWLQMTADVKKVQSELANVQIQLADVKARKAILATMFQKTRDNFIANNLQKLVDAERQARTLEQKLSESTTQLKRMTLRSPINGTVVASSLTTVGQVVAPGEAIMRVVPADTQLEVIAYVPNQDIGFIREGQHVDVKIDAFPFTRYGTLSGTIKRVSKDAIPASDAQQAQSDPTRPNAKTQSGKGQATQNLVFPLTVEIERDHMNIDGRQVNLVPGMSVTAEIKTGRRRLIEYLISPIYNLTSSSLRER